MMSEKIRELARKLLELANQGIGGEKENAQTMLDRLLKQHGLSIEDLLQEQMRPVHFRKRIKDPMKQNAFLLQIAASVIGSKRVSESWVVRNTSDNTLYYKIDLTAAEEIEIKAKYDFYWRDYTEQADVFRDAYIQKNKLYANPDKDNGGPGELTDEEFEKMQKTAKMMRGIEEKIFLKQLK